MNANSASLFQFRSPIDRLVAVHLLCSGLAGLHIMLHSSYDDCLVVVPLRRGVLEGRPFCSTAATAIPSLPFASSEECLSAPCTAASVEIKVVVINSSATNSGAVLSCSMADMTIASRNMTDMMIRSSVD